MWGRWSAFHGNVQHAQFPAGVRGLGGEGGGDFLEGIPVLLGNAVEFQAKDTGGLGGKFGPEKRFGVFAVDLDILSQKLHILVGVVFGTQEDGGIYQLVLREIIADRAKAVEYQVSGVVDGLPWQGQGVPVIRGGVALDGQVVQVNGVCGVVFVVVGRQVKVDVLNLGDVSCGKTFLAEPQPTRNGFAGGGFDVKAGKV